MGSLRNLVALVGMLAASTALGTNAFALSAVEACRGTWSNCGVAVKIELEKRPSDAKTVVDLAGLWAVAYDKQFNWLRSKGKLQQSTPDADKIFEAVRSKLDPLDIASDKVRDKVVEALLKRYLAHLAPIVQFASGPIGEALKVFFDSSEIATDFDELRLMNDDIQRRLGSLLEPYLKPNWQALVNRATQEAIPTIRKQ